MASWWYCDMPEVTRAEAVQCGFAGVIAEILGLLVVVACVAGNSRLAANARRVLGVWPTQLLMARCRLVSVVVGGGTGVRMIDWRANRLRSGYVEVGGSIRI